MQITEWFNPYDVKHLEAYIEYKLFSKWPDGLLKDGEEFDEAMEKRVAYSLANICRSLIIDKNKS